MSDKKAKLAAVPTNIITGFLGVGKTSAIMHLLKSKPANEKWAVLVNEFGEIGVDGSLFQGTVTNEQHVFIREVPGGCMCCASGLPMQIALNQLLSKALPDRLLIEPTGLGHPEEVLALLSNEYYRDVLSLQKTVTLVDARNLKDKRYTEHPTFKQQLNIADVVVGNKLDLYAPGDQALLHDYLKTLSDNNKQVYFTQQGEIPLAWIKGQLSRAADKHAHHHHHHSAKTETLASDLPLPESGMIKAVNEGEGFVSVGWRFSPKKIFNIRSIREFIRQADAIRVKAIFITAQGIYAFNKTEDGVSEFSVDEVNESRIEIICREINDHWQDQLNDAMLKNEEEG